MIFIALWYIPCPGDNWYFSVSSIICLINPSMSVSLNEEWGDAIHSR